MLKTVYFIRHGETLLNRKHIHQYPETPLTDKGREQAHAAAKALKDLGIEHIVSSDLARAAETGSILARTLDLPLTYAEELREIRRPTFLWGKSHYGVSSLWFFLQYFVVSMVSPKQLRNVETVLAFEQRINRGLDVIVARPEQRIAVVTHRGVMTLLGLLMRTNGKPNRFALWLAFMKLYSIDNAEITVAVHDGDKWSLRVSNKKEHLQGVE